MYEDSYKVLVALDDELRDRLKAHAKSQKKTMSRVVREVLDKELPPLEPTNKRRVTRATRK